MKILSYSLEIEGERIFVARDQTIMYHATLQSYELYMYDHPCSKIELCLKVSHCYLSLYLKSLKHKAVQCFSCPQIGLW